MDANPVDQHVQDMLVVDSTYERLVLEILGGQAQPHASDSRLGLSLVSLTSADTAAAELERRPGVLDGQSKDPDLKRAEWSPVDRLLENLRAAFRHDYGWTPTMGKNRYLTPVQAVTYPNAGGVGGPKFVSAEKLTEADKRRAQHPDAGLGVRIGLPDTVFFPNETLTGRYVLSEPTKDVIVPKEPASASVGGGTPYVDGHCTLLASLILREAPAARLDIRPVLVSPAEAERDPDRTVWDVARKMVEYLDSGVQIINCSWACLTRDGEAPLVLERAIGMLTPTILVVAAASNHGELIAKRDSPDATADDKAQRKGRLPERFAPAFPAALSSVVAVGALDKDGPADFNPVVRDGTKLAPWIDVLAPGVDRIGAYLGSKSRPETVDVPVNQPKGELADEPELEEKQFEGAASWTGTSFAAAIVTGAIAGRINGGTSAHQALADLLADGSLGRPPGSDG